jgi:hypothetical protein
MVPLPPDLDRVGDELVGAAARALAARRRRRRLIGRLVATAVAGVLSAAWLVPATLGPAVRSENRLLARVTPSAASSGFDAVPGLPAVCDLPPAGRLTLRSCRPDEPIRPGRRGRW